MACLALCAAGSLFWTSANSTEALEKLEKPNQSEQNGKHSCCQGMKIALEQAKDKTPAKESKKGKKEKQSTTAKDAPKDPKESKPAETTAIDRKPVLDPSQFAGLAAFGYASAKAAPEVMEKLFCYCGCDLTDSHTSLLDCFTSAHGVDCHICQEEAVLALKMHKDGTPIKQIQQEIDERYSDKYPFEEQTPAYKKYKSTRLWTSSGTAGDTTAASTTAASTDKATQKEAAGPAGPDGPDEKCEKKPPKLKPGKTVGKCCGAGHDHNDKSKKK